MWRQENDNFMEIANNVCTERMKKLMPASQMNKKSKIYINLNSKPIFYDIKVPGELMKRQLRSVCEKINGSTDGIPPFSFK